METGTIWMLGRCGEMEVLFVDADDDYVEYVKVNGEIVPEVPKKMYAQFKACLHYRTRITKMVGEEWLEN